MPYWIIATRQYAIIATLVCIRTAFSVVFQKFFFPKILLEPFEEQLNQLSFSYRDWRHPMQKVASHSSLRQKGLIPFSRIDRKVYYNKEDILNYMKKNLKTHTNNGNGTDGIE